MSNRPPAVLAVHPRSPSLSWDDCRLLVESVVDYAIFMLDAEGNVATWNPGAARIKGYTAEEVVGRHFSIFFLPEQIEAGQPEHELAMARDVGRVETEGWRVRKDGSRFWANVVLSAIRDELGRIRGYGKVTRDLTDRKRAEDELRASEERFHLLVDGVTDYAVFMLDPAGHVRSWNSGARRIKRYEPEEIIGKHLSTFYTPEDRLAGKPERILEQVRRDGRFEDEGIRVRKGGERFWANVVITAVRNGQGELLGFAKVTRDLTERRRSELELRRANERFHLLVEAVSDYAIFMLDVNGRVATWNSGARNVKGYEADEIVGSHFSCFYTPEDRAAGKPQRVLQTVLDEGRFAEESWRVRKDGTRFWANVVITALRDEAGELLGFAKVTRDLTERREAEDTERKLLEERAARAAAEAGEQRLRESEERYRALSRRLEVIFEGVTDSILVEDGTGKLVFANRAAASMLGFPSVEALLAGSAETIRARFEAYDEHGRPLAPDERPAARVLRGEQPGSVLMRVFEKQTGRSWWWLVRAGVASGGGGEPELAISVWHDVTAEKRRDWDAQVLSDATAVLASSLDEGRMLSSLARVLVPAIADYCAIALLDGARLRTAAQAWVDGERVADGTAAEVPASDPDRSTPRGVWRVIQTGQSELFDRPTPEQLAVTITNREHRARLDGAPIRAALVAPIRVRERVAGTLCLVTHESERCYDHHDVVLAEELARRTGIAVENAGLYTAAQQAARAAEAGARAAEQANRIKDEFLATVSHELRTPLNAIVGWVGMLRHRPLEANVAKAIDVIDRNARAQVKIIEDILDVSRIINGKLRIEPKPTDLVATTREAIEVVRPSALAKRIKIELETSAESCLLVGDPERLQQVAWNLLSNAVKFTDAGGTIRVRVGKQASSAVLSVSDTGRGIDPEFLPFVFERFKQADASTTRRFGGLGLGLALVRHIVELHGGSVAASSEGKNTGATFTVTLPVRAIVPPPPVEQPDSVSQTPQPPAARGLLRELRVLVVDDDADARDLLAAVLGDAGAVVRAASSAREGFQLVREFRPQILVSDIGMPDEDGYSLARKVRELRPEEGGGIPSIALTAYTRNEDRNQAAAAGFTTHVGKPVSPEALVATVANLIPFTRH